MANEELRCSGRRVAEDRRECGAAPASGESQVTLFTGEETFTIGKGKAETLPRADFSPVPAASTATQLSAAFPFIS